MPVLRLPFEDFLTHLPIPLLVKDENHKYVFINDLALVFFSVSREEVLGKTDYEFFPSEQATLFQALDKELLREGGVKEVEEEISNPDGSITFLHTRKFLLKVHGHQYILVTLHDMTERREHVRKLSLLQEAVDRSHTSFFLLDTMGNIEYVNMHACHALGYAREELLDKSVYDIAPGVTRSDFDDVWFELRSKGNMRVQSQHQRKDGSIFPVEVSCDYVSFDGKERAFCYAEDITERKRTAAYIWKLALHDPLTNLPNRTLLHDRLTVLLTESLRHQKNFCVLLFDLDRFKNINDTLGHTAGDEVLVQVASRITKSLRATDTLARLGGDEFVILLPETNIEGARLVAESILCLITKPMALGRGELIYPQGSIGISCFPKDTDQPDSLIRYADIAMYQAKTVGGNTYREFSEELKTAAANRFNLDVELRTALIQDQFELWLQPQHESGTGRMCGAEGLLRWCHPTKGYISPAEFIPIAEANGQVIDIGRWVIATALEYLNLLREAGIGHFAISINFSARQLRDEGLADYLIDQLATHHLEASDLELEVTESLMLPSELESFDFFERMKKLGVKVAIDDFGTGYSSLSHLRRLPVSKLKIDRSFVKHIMEDEQDAEMARLIIGLAHQFGLKVIAEGVETLEQSSFLKDNGCDQIQGFYFSKPLPIDDFKNYAIENECGDYHSAIR